jgi:hypothetical protein
MKADLEIAKIDEKAKAEVSLHLLEAKLDHLSQQAEFLHERKMQLDAPPPPVKPTPPEKTKPVSESLNYKDAPPDIRRQIEAQAGLEPSKMGVLELAERRAKAMPKPAAAAPAGVGPYKLPTGKKPAKAPAKK